MKFLRILLLPLLSILLVTGNQTLWNLYSYPLGVSSDVKNSTKTDVSARDWAMKGGGGNLKGGGAGGSKAAGGVLKKGQGSSGGKMGDTATGAKNTQASKINPGTATDFSNRVTQIQSKVGKNSIKLPGENPNVRYRYDLQGAPHKGVPTPHVQREIRNVAPDGTVHWNKDNKWVDHVTSKDLDRIERHLNSLKND